MVNLIDILLGRRTSSAAPPPRAEEPAGRVPPLASLQERPPAPKPPAKENLVGHTEALKRIQRARTQTDLQLNGLKLASLPSEISALTHLKTLNLSDNALADDAISALRGLKNLTTLYVRKNKIGAAGIAAMAALEKLATLDISANAMGDEAALALARLRTLRTLTADANKIGSAGAKALAGLSNLRSLSLRENAVGDEGAQALASLVNLKKLNLARNGIGPQGMVSMARLTALTSLHLSDNALGDEGVKPLEALAALTLLDISNTGIEAITLLEHLPKLATACLNSVRLKDTNAPYWRLKGGPRVYLHKAQLGDVPPELLSKHQTDDCRSRLRTYFVTQEEDANREPDVIIRDVKVMILGNGRIGKTQMRRRLDGLDYNEDTPTTHGVEIISVDLPLHGQSGEEPDVTPLKIWDFGGQDIYLGTHALFLKTRAVFAVLWTPAMEANATQDELGLSFRNYPLVEWARYVQQLGSANSPLILIQSQCEATQDRRPAPIDPQLRGSFAYPPQEIYYSARLAKPHEALSAALRDAVDWLAKDGPVRISAKWSRVKSEIERIARAENNDPPPPVAETDSPDLSVVASPTTAEFERKRSMTLAEFDQICATQGITKKKQRSVLLDLLHQFGTVFHDPDVLGDTIILDQDWALQAIYSLFDRESGAYDHLRSLRGRFTRATLGDLIWNRDGYSEADQRAFVAMMKACRVAFELRPATEHDPEALYIAPDLLPERRLVAGEIRRGFDEDQADAACEMKFAFAVPSLLRELMAMWGAEAGQDGVYWSNGLSFYDDTTKSRALIEVERPEPGSWRAHVHIKTWTGEAGALMNRLAAKVIEVAERFNAQIEGAGGAVDATIPSADGSESVAPPAIVPAPAPTERPRCFISYKHNSISQEAMAAIVRQLEAQGMEPYFDTKELAYNESISAFMKAGAATGRFVLILTEDYFKSPYCMIELLAIWRDCKWDAGTFQSRVRACVLDARIDTIEDRDRVRMHWEGELSNITQRISAIQAAKGDVPSDYNDTRSLAIQVINTAPTILHHVADVINIRSVADVSKLSFRPKD